MFEEDRSFADGLQVAWEGASFYGMGWERGLTMRGTALLVGGFLGCGDGLCCHFTRTHNRDASPQFFRRIEAFLVERASGFSFFFKKLN